ncbi:MAG: BON domain-containing protein [Planctomycetaceae bacterium]
MRTPRTTLERREDSAESIGNEPHFTASEATAVAESPHDLELAIRRELLSQSGLKFSSLVVRRIPKGVCLEGVLEADDGSPDIGGLVRRVAGVDKVLNHLVTHCPSPRPRKKG